MVAADARVKWSFRDKPGVVAARHDAVEIATGDIFVFIDDDVAIPDPFFLARHAINYEALSDLDVVVGREVYLGQTVPTVAPFPPTPDDLTRGTRFPGTLRRSSHQFRPHAVGSA